MKSKEKLAFQESHKCLLSSLISPDNRESQISERAETADGQRSHMYTKLRKKSTQLRQQRQSELSFGKNSLPPTATPKTQLTNRKSKQLSVMQIQQLISQPELRRNKTILLELNQFANNTSRSHEKQVDLQSMSENRRVQWLEKQNSILQQPNPSTFSENSQPSKPIKDFQTRIQYQAKATNYNNFLKRFTESKEQFLEEKLGVEKVEHPKILASYGPKDRQFVYKQPLKTIRGMTDHILRQRSIRIFQLQEQKEDSPRQEPSTFRSRISIETEKPMCQTKEIKWPSNQQRYELTDKLREKFTNYYNQGVDSLKQLKDNRRDPNFIFKELHIEEIQYTDYEKAQKNPINLPLFSMLKEEEIILKQKQVEECEQYTANELITKMKETEKIDEQTHMEYQRRSYLERQNHLSISESYKKMRTHQKKYDSVEIPMTKPVKIIEQSVKERRKKILNLIKIYLFRLHELKLTMHDVIQLQAFPPTPYFRERTKVFFDCVKNNNYHQVQWELEQNKFLVYDYDANKFCALHHAVIRNQLNVVQILLNFHSDVNSKDILGRTPLFFAIRGGYSDCVLLLLKYFANPWSTHKNTYDAYLDRLTEKVREAYRLSKRLHLQIQMMPFCKREQFWKEKLFNFTQQQ